MSSTNPKYRELVGAASNGQLELVETLLNRGADIEERDGAGDTPLNEAARKGYLAIVRLLIERGARITAPNNDGTTALKYAIERNFHEIVKELRDAEERARTPAKEWVLMAEDAVACVRTYPKMRRRITEIFNFESRERLIISENTATRAEAVTPAASFDDLPQAQVERALEQFSKLGGTADRGFVLRGITRLDKNGPGLS